MQLFGLVNTMLQNDRTTADRDLSIARCCKDFLLYDVRSLNIKVTLVQNLPLFADIPPIQES